jgi:hypothetical protein
MGGDRSNAAYGYIAKEGRDDVKSWSFFVD